MAASTCKTTLYTSEQFVESSGAILFDLSQATTSVCLIHCAAKDEWLLAKGRRNCHESRQDAALREVWEETGYRCHLHPVTMATRAPAATSACDAPDEARVWPSLTEPFMLSIREKAEGNVKVIWWYVAEVERDTPKTEGEAGFTAEFFDCDEALRRLTFQGDRDVLLKAMSLLGS